MIELQNIQRLNKEDIIDLLLDEQKMPFDIYIPKTTVQFSSSNEDISLDYAGLSYCGHLLNMASDSFEYTFVPPTQHTSILFKVSAKEFTKLADAIFEISKGFSNVQNEEDEFDFREGMSQYIYDIESGKTSVVCNELHKVYKTFKV